MAYDAIHSFIKHSRFGSAFRLLRGNSNISDKKKIIDVNVLFESSIAVKISYTLWYFRRIVTFINWRQCCLQNTIYICKLLILYFVFFFAPKTVINEKHIANHAVNWCANYEIYMSRHVRQGAHFIPMYLLVLFSDMYDRLINLCLQFSNVLFEKLDQIVIFWQFIIFRYLFFCFVYGWNKPN